MTAVPPASATAADRPWDALRAELDAWADAGRTATFWWRDDDAVEPTPALDRLCALAGAAGVPLALAVIPAHATAALARALDAHPGGRPGVSVIQHGWSHANHAPPGAKKTELGAERPADAVLAELAAGRERLAALFGGRFVAALAPPWNRIAPAVPARLPEAGLVGLSTHAARGPARPGLTQVNTHLDPVDWHGAGAAPGGARAFLGDAAALAPALAHLAARRAGTADPDEPTGLLTHHLVMDEATWTFAERFLTVTRAHPAARWLDAPALFAGDA